MESVGPLELLLVDLLLKVEEIGHNQMMWAKIEAL